MHLAVLEHDNLGYMKIKGNTKRLMYIKDNCSFISQYKTNCPQFLTADWQIVTHKNNRPQGVQSKS